MAVVDFRAGGFQGAQPERHAQDFSYSQNGAGEAYHDEWQQEEWDHADHRHGAYGTLDGAPLEAPTLMGRLSRMGQYFGALVSVGLIVILAVWGFKLVVRDVSGVPVIRAIAGDARTAPADPGGELSDRTGLAVNTVAAGARPARTDRVELAPGATGLETQDVPMGALGATAQQPSRVDLPLLDESARVIAQSDGETAAAAVAAAAALNEELSAAISDAPANEAPVNEALTDLSGQAPQDTAITQALAEANAPVIAPAVAQSVRPAPRPRRMAAAASTASDATAPTAPSAAAATTESRPAAAPAAAPAADQAPAAAKVASGSALAQIGAFDSNALAAGEWKRVSGKFGALFAGKAMVVQEHKANGRTFWRLRAGGFASKDEARRFCAALIAEGVDCIPAAAK